MRTLTPTQIEAMLIRHDAALRLRKHGEIEALEALRLVVAPPPDVLRASMVQAMEQGAGYQAKMLADKPANRGQKKRARRWQRDNRVLSATPSS